jgi:hypothetical protein
LFERPSASKPRTSVSARSKQSLRNRIRRLRREAANSIRQMGRHLRRRDQFIARDLFDRFDHILKWPVRRNDARWACLDHATASPSGTPTATNFASGSRYAWSGEDEVIEPRTIEECNRRAVAVAELRERLVKRRRIAHYHELRDVVEHRREAFTAYANGETTKTSVMVRLVSGPRDRPAAGRSLAAATIETAHSRIRRSPLRCLSSDYSMPVVPRQRATLVTAQARGVRGRT